MAKRFYKENEQIWIKSLKKVGVIRKLNIPNLEATVEYDDNIIDVFKFTDIDKYRAKETTKKDGKTTIQPKKAQRVNTLLVAKINPDSDAKIPSKQDEDAGYDFYACFEQDELFIPRFQPTLISTGIATSLLPQYYLNLKHERGSTGLRGMAVLSGVIDSSYRGEIFINITPLYKDIVISKDTEEVLEQDDVIIYPYSKAIAQGTIEEVPVFKVKEISYEDLLKIPSQRGKGKLDSTNK